MISKKKQSWGLLALWINSMRLEGAAKEAAEIPLAGLVVKYLYRNLKQY